MTDRPLSVAASASHESRLYACAGRGVTDVRAPNAGVLPPVRVAGIAGPPAASPDTTSSPGTVPTTSTTP